MLACGGYENNWTMVSNYNQIPYMYPSGGKLNTGDGVTMGQEVGADLWHMSNISGLGYCHQTDTASGSIITSTKGVDYAIYAGPTGGRFMNEKSHSRHGRISYGGGWNMTPMPMPMYMVTDSSHIDEPMLRGFSDGNEDEIASGDIIVADTVEELGEKIREAGKAPSFNANGELQAALDRYNAHCHAAEGGEQDDFGRQCVNPIEVGPFYACELQPKMLNTQGGPRHNGRCEVLDTKAMPIHGLFSAGELGSIFPDMYNGGGNLGETMVFGRIAGTNAALNAQGQFEPTAEPAQYVSVGPEGQVQA